MSINTKYKENLNELILMINALTIILLLSIKVDINIPSQMSELLALKKDILY